MTSTIVSISASLAGFRLQAARRRIKAWLGSQLWRSARFYTADDPVAGKLDQSAKTRAGEDGGDPAGVRHTLTKP